MSDSNDKLSETRSSKEAPPQAEILREEVINQLPDAIKAKLDPNETQQVIAIAARISRQHRGPLPTADDYAKYEAAYQGSALRILDYMDKEQEHRHAMDHKMLEHSMRETIRGQTLAFITMLCLIGAAIYCANTGHEVIAGVFIASTALSIVGKFIDGKDGKSIKKNPLNPAKKI